MGVRQMLFSEIYGSYFNVVAAVLSEAAENTLTTGKLTAIVQEKRLRKVYCPFLPPCSPEHGRYWTAATIRCCEESRQCL